MRLSVLRILTVLGSLSLLLIMVAACGTSTGTVTTGSPVADGVRPAAELLTPRATPGPVNLPADDAPHDDLTEWWYFTGHLTTDSGHQFGFEFVIFQGNRFGFPPTYASHFAITDATGGTFSYDQRTQIGGQPRSGKTIDLTVGGWTLAGSGPKDEISASMSGYDLNLTVESQKPPALHDGDGYFTWAPATGSYYYSRTRMSASGTLTVNGVQSTVTGQAWMDHQWGNFLLIGGGGWNWYSLQLDNGNDIMLWHSRDSQNMIIFGSGTYVDQTGATTQIDQSGFTITPTGTWTSPHSGATYASGWTIDIPSRSLNLTVTPVIPDQELDTTKSTGVVYWEGDVTISGSQNGQPVQGQGYIELTGYASGSSAP